MKMKFTKGLVAVLMLAFGSANVMAQETETFVLDPTQLQPAQDGYYIAGAWKDEQGDDGVDEFYNGCYDAYGDSHHMETGTTEDGFTYSGAMVMPDCAGKGTPPEGWPAEGYLQLGKHKYPNTDTAQFGYIITPSFTNLQSLEILVGTDNSVGEHRRIDMMIESSTDGGETWTDGWFIRYQLINQGGDVVSFEADGESVAFNGMVEESQENPMVLRISTIPAPDAVAGERLKIFGVELVATSAGGGGAVGIGDDFDENPFFTLQNNTFVANQGKISVYTITGTFVGSGKNVSIPTTGLYIVRSDKGKAQKIVVQ